MANANAQTASMIIIIILIWKNEILLNKQQSSKIYRFTSDAKSHNTPHSSSVQIIGFHSSVSFATFIYLSNF